MEQRIIRTSVVVLLGVGILPFNTDAASDNDSLESRLKAVEEKLEKRDEESSSSGSLSIYGSLRPTFAPYIEENNNKTSDVNDALSRIGLNGSIPLTPSIKGIFEGEWSVDIANEGNFGNSRKAYAGLEGFFGRVAIGKQRPPQYLLIAEPVDIFNHANSPFAYDVVSPFFIDNAVTYGFSGENFDILSLGQFNGDSGDDHADVVNVGAAYHNAGYYLAFTYLKSTLPGATDPTAEGDENTTWALASYVEWEPVYLAAAFQHLDIDQEGGGERDGHTFDISAALDLSAALGWGDGYRLKAGYFDFDDGRDSGSLKQNGIDITLEYQWTKQFRVHLEYLDRFLDEQPDFTSVTVGVRYDFEAELL